MKQNQVTAFSTANGIRQWQPPMAYANGVKSCPVPPYANGVTYANGVKSCPVPLRQWGQVLPRAPKVFCLWLFPEMIRLIVP
jgi:hypothetical protein